MDVENGLESIKTILVVDDDEQLLRYFQEGLLMSGYGVVVAANGREGLDQYNQHRPDVVVTDFEMGVDELNGLELADSIRKIEEKNKKVPILILSGNIEGVIGEGLDIIRVKKPVDTDRLAKMISNLLEISSG